MQAKLGQPEVGSPKAKVFIIIISINTPEIIQNKKPIIEAIARGAVVNAVIPSKAYFTSFQKDHLVSPAALFTFSL